MNFILFFSYDFYVFQLILRIFYKNRFIVEKNENTYKFMFRI